MTQTQRNLLLFAGVALLFILTGVFCKAGTCR
jgi:hypothetical protein